MITYYPKITIFGSYFSPNKIIASVGDIFTNKNERGELGTTGRYKGQPLPYGSADIIPPKNIIAEDDKLLWLIKTYTTILNKMKETGAEDITFHIDVAYKNQCNLAFDAEILKKISSLQIPLTISCWENNEE